MKKLYGTILSLLFTTVLFAQTVTYEIPVSGLVGLTLTSGDICSPPFVGPEEAKQTSIGNQWGCTWVSTGSGIVTSVDVEVMFTLNNLTNIPTLLNGVSNNTQTGLTPNCAASTMLTWSVDPSSYNVGGTNTFLADYASSAQINQIDHLYQSTQDIYMTVTVTYSPCTAPTVSVSEITPVTCNGGSDGAINITVTGGTAPYTYDWDYDGTGDFDDPEDLSGVPAGVYTVVVMGDLGCTVSITDTITEPDTLDVTVSQGGSGLYANATGVSYQWIDCEGPTAISGATTQGFTPTSNGNYAVVITDGPCSDTSDCVVVTNAGLEDNDGYGTITVFPNPSNGSFQLILPQEFKEVKVELYDMAGRIVYSSIVANENTFITIDVPDLASGTYNLKVIAENATRSVPVVIR
ncbi:MAG: T9SS type A sorting domain-containing protein [Crocinitomicaceae bacterium]|nr:T9SS type A sorting domain-containing protein [Crocinitomicaceae bacterium]